MSSGSGFRLSLLSIFVDGFLLSFKLGSSSVMSFFDDKRVLPRYCGVN